MDKKKVQSILQDALEAEIPSTEINLWPAVKTNLVAGSHPYFQQGEKMNTTRKRRLSKLAIAGLATVALSTLALVTPQGRALAQEVIQLFNRAESHERPLPPEQIPSIGDAQSQATAIPPAPLMSVSDAEKTAGFDAKELPATPEGFTFLGAMGMEGSISIEYQAQGNGGTLVINQSRNGFMQSEWDQAPVEAISQTKVGNLDAEIVQGAYVVYPGEDIARWNPDAPILRLRWIEDGIWFEMAKFGGVEAIAYLDREGLTDLAESMVYTP